MAMWWARPNALKALNTKEVRHLCGLRRRPLNRMITGHTPASPLLVAVACAEWPDTSVSDLFELRTTPSP